MVSYREKTSTATDRYWMDLSLSPWGSWGHVRHSPWQCKSYPCCCQQQFPATTKKHFILTSKTPIINITATKTGTYEKFFELIEIENEQRKTHCQKEIVNPIYTETKTPNNVKWKYNVLTFALKRFVFYKPSYITVDTNQQLIVIMHCFTTTRTH